MIVCTSQHFLLNIGTSTTAVGGMISDHFATCTGEWHCPERGICRQLQVPQRMTRARSISHPLTFERRRWWAGFNLELCASLSRCPPSPVPLGDAVQRVSAPEPLGQTLQRSAEHGYVRLLHHLSRCPQSLIILDNRYAAATTQEWQWLVVCY